MNKNKLTFLSLSFAMLLSLLGSNGSSPLIAATTDSGTTQAEETKMSLAVVSSTSHSSGSSEGISNLVDGNANTKWCATNSSDSTSMSITFEAAEAFVFVSYAFTTAADSAKYTHRNWKTWKIYGGDSADACNECLVNHQNNDLASLNEANSTKTSFKDLTGFYTSYKFYKLDFTFEKTGSDTYKTQMAEVEFYGYTGSVSKYLNDTTYFEILDSYKNLNWMLNYKITSETTDYSWEGTFSDISYSFSGNSASENTILMGAYYPGDGDYGTRTGYLYNDASDPTKTYLAIGRTKVSDGITGLYKNSNQNTIHAKFVASGDTKTYSFGDTLGIVDSNKDLTGNWEGSYALNTSFYLSHNLSLKCYGIKIWEGTEIDANLKVNIAPKILYDGHGYFFGYYDSLDRSEAGGRFVVTGGGWHQSDVILDQQGGEGGSTSVHASAGYAFSNIVMPEMDGYVCTGYWTEKNGQGTQYFNQDGQCVRAYPSDTGTTLYANWKEVTFEIASYSVAIANNLDLIVQVSKDVITAHYKDLKVKFTQNGKSTTVTDYVINGKYAEFRFSDIQGKYVVDNITAELTGTYQNVPVSATSKTCSIKDYCTSVATKSYQFTDSDAYWAKVRRKNLCIALLNYAAACQIYSGYKTSTLANADLLSGDNIVDTRMYTSCLDQTNSKYTSDNNNIEIGYANILLENSINMQIGFTADSVAGLTMKFFLGSEEIAGSAVALSTVTKTVTSVNTQTTYKVVDFRGLKAYQLSDVVTIKIVNQSGQTLCSINYSVESYAAAKWDIETKEGPKTEDTENLGQLIVAIMAYGDAAKDYVGE